MGRASVIEAYIQRLLAWNQPITPAILKAIAAGVGITQGELDAINLQVETHFKRGRNHIEAGELNEGIDQLMQAKALDPVNVEVLLSLAYAYNLRYNQDSDLSDRRQALIMAKRCVELNPKDKESQALVSTWEHTTNSSQLYQQAKPNIFILISFLENIFNPRRISRRTKTKIAFLILFLQQPISLTTIARWLMPPFFVVTGGIAVVGLSFVGWENVPVFSKSESIALVRPPVFDPGLNVPVSFNYPGLLIEPRISRLGEYDGEIYYKLKGLILNDSGQEIRRLYLTVELLDPDGIPMSKIDQIAVTGSGRIIRPDSFEPFELFHRSPPTLNSVRVSVTDIEQLEQFNPYE